MDHDLTIWLAASAATIISGLCGIAAIVGAWKSRKYMRSAQESAVEANRIAEEILRETKRANLREDTRAEREEFMKSLNAFLGAHKDIWKKKQGGAVLGACF